MHEDQAPTTAAIKAVTQPEFEPRYRTHGAASGFQDDIAASPVYRGHARLNPNCVVCGVHNAKGLQLEFQQDREQLGVGATWVPTTEWESFQGTVHGGIITTVLDEAMSKAVIAQNWEALTVDLRVRFRDRVAPGERLQVRGWVVEKHRRRILTEATLVNESGAERAHAWATFLVARS